MLSEPTKGTRNWQRLHAANVNQMRQSLKGQPKRAREAAAKRFAAGRVDRSDDAHSRVVARRSRQEGSAGE
jgi:hypothetical protein